MQGAPEISTSKRVRHLPCCSLEVLQEPVVRETCREERVEHVQGEVACLREAVRAHEEVVLCVRWIGEEVQFWR